jgi:hypothetical protein
MIPDRPDRVPDAIEPFIGYRAWYFAVDRHSASLLPLGNRDQANSSAWDEASHRWVSAACLLQSAAMSDSARDRLEAIFAKLGRRPPDFVLNRLLLLDWPLHGIPNEGCSCGFYAMKDLGSVQEPDGYDVILGRVELAGKVIECTSGYRAERARINQLIPIHGRERRAKRVAKHLGLPLAPAIAPWTFRAPG